MHAYDALHVRNRLAQTIASLGASRKSKSTAKIVKVCVWIPLGHGASGVGDAFPRKPCCLLVLLLAPLPVCVTV
jgi:hypothetical protein